MKQSSYRVRTMIIRAFLGAMIISIIFFSLIAVMFSFNLEDEIFDLQVRSAIDQFVEEKKDIERPNGTFRSLEMDYYLDTENMPEWLLSEIDPAYQDRSFEVFAKERGHFHVYVHTMPDDKRLYVLFNARRFIRSTPHIKAFLVVITVMAGLAAIISFFVLSRMSRKVSTPLEQMVHMLADGSRVDGRMKLPENAPRELHTLSDAIAARDARIQTLIEREQQFNRDVSHELRTPLAVASGAAEIMEERGGNSPALRRLTTAIKDMQQLTEGILWLGREPDQSSSCKLDDVCKSSIKSCGHLIGGKDITIDFHETGFSIPVPEPVAHVIIGNLLRNALAYTDNGKITLSAEKHRFVIQDTGIGFGNAAMERKGFGVGLSLVKRLCDHFGIEFSVVSHPEGGSIATLTWV